MTSESSSNAQNLASAYLINKSGMVINKFSNKPYNFSPENHTLNEQLIYKFQKFMPSYFESRGKFYNLLGIEREFFASNSWDTSHEDNNPLVIFLTGPTQRFGPGVLNARSLLEKNGGVLAATVFGYLERCIQLNWHFITFMPLHYSSVFCYSPDAPELLIYNLLSQAVLPMPEEEALIICQDPLALSRPIRPVFIIAHGATGPALLSPFRASNLEIYRACNPGFERSFYEASIQSTLQPQAPNQTNLQSHPLHQTPQHINSFIQSPFSGSMPNLSSSLTNPVPQNATYLNSGHNNNNSNSNSALHNNCYTNTANVNFTNSQFHSFQQNILDNPNLFLNARNHSDASDGKFSEQTLTSEQAPPSYSSLFLNSGSDEPKNNNSLNHQISPGVQPGLLASSPAMDGFKNFAHDQIGTYINHMSINLDTGHSDFSTNCPNLDQNISDSRISMAHSQTLSEIEISSSIWEKHRSLYLTQFNRTIRGVVFLDSVVDLANLAITDIDVISWLHTHCIQYLCSDAPLDFPLKYIKDIPCFSAGTLDGGLIGKTVIDKIFNHFWNSTQGSVNTQTLPEFKFDFKFLNDLIGEM